MIKDKKIYYATHPEARAMKNKQDLEWKKRNHEKVKARRVRSNTISLDRIYSSKGYVEGNVVFCCSEINIMKNKMDYDYFIKICESILQHTSRIAFHSK